MYISLNVCVLSGGFMQAPLPLSAQINPCRAARLAQTVRKPPWLPRLVVWLSWFLCFSLVPSLPRKKRDATNALHRSCGVLVAPRPSLSLASIAFFLSGCHLKLTTPSVTHRAHEYHLDHNCRSPLRETAATSSPPARPGACVRVRAFAGCVLVRVLRHTVMDQTGLPCSALCTVFPFKSGRLAHAGSLGFSRCQLSEALAGCPPIGGGRRGGSEGGLLVVVGGLAAVCLPPFITKHRGLRACDLDHDAVSLGAHVRDSVSCVHPP